ncbi:unnamed protein product [Acanthoscelides obtectus]|uniref:Uncharacterized protein n=1 Tax=Acanthoscelides obtectus TaxID=200917 RepID=A0A9P0JMY1_ACAOB|nr:unnamed protein product [Acanthoscelides obtectus]CAK1661076.1 hypothetical protein AOBTE_LOCUS22423 [Acanthoscelides obtectus]
MLHYFQIMSMVSSRTKRILAALSQNDNRIMLILRKKSGLCRYPLFQVTIFLI